MPRAEHNMRRRMLAVALAAGFAAATTGVILDNPKTIAAVENSFTKILNANVEPIPGSLTILDTKVINQEQSPFAITGDVTSFKAADGSSRYLANTADGTHLFIASETLSFESAVENQKLTAENFPLVLGTEPGLQSRSIRSSVQTDPSNLDHLYGFTQDQKAADPQSTDKLPITSISIIESADGGKKWTVLKKDFLTGAGVAQSNLDTAGVRNPNAIFDEPRSTVRVAFEDSTVLEDKNQPYLFMIPVNDDSSLDLSNTLFWLNSRALPYDKYQLQPIRGFISPSEISRTAVDDIGDLSFTYISSLKSPFALATANQGPISSQGDFRGFGNSWTDPKRFGPPDLQNNDAQEIADEQISYVPNPTDPSGASGDIYKSTGFGPNLELSITSVVFNATNGG